MYPLNHKAARLFSSDMTAKVSLSRSQLNMVMSLNHIHLNNNKPTRVGLPRLAAAAAVLPAAIHHCQRDSAAARHLGPPANTPLPLAGRKRADGFGGRGPSHLRIFLTGRAATLDWSDVRGRRHDTRHRRPSHREGGEAAVRFVASDGEPVQCLAGSI